MKLYVMPFNSSLFKGNVQIDATFSVHGLSLLKYNYNWIAFNMLRFNKRFPNEMHICMLPIYNKLHLHLNLVTYSFYRTLNF